MVQRVVIGLLTLLLAGVLAAPAVVLAHEGDNDTTETDKPSPALNEKTPEQIEAYKEQYKKELEAKREAAKQAAEAKKKQLEDRMEAVKEEVKERRAELKKDVCENRRERLQELLPGLKQRSVALHANINKVYERTQAFYADNGLSLVNYDELLAAAELAKANAATAVDALQAYDFEVNCSDDSVAANLDGYRAAAGAAKQALNEYRGAVVSLIKSIKNVAAEASNE